MDGPVLWMIKINLTSKDCSLPMSGRSGNQSCQIGLHAEPEQAQHLTCSVAWKFSFRGLDTRPLVSRSLEDDFGSSSRPACSVIIALSCCNHHPFPHHGSIWV